MANEKHLAIVRQGVEAWNRWRLEHPGIKPELQDADLRRADLAQANLQEANLQGAILQGSHLTSAMLLDADVGGADLRYASLQGVNLRGAILKWTDLERANLEDADLRGCHLQGTNLRGADLAQALVNVTTFNNLDLREVQHLDMVQHQGPSTIGIDTLYRSQGQIPEIFLRGCGVPNSMIEYSRALIAAEHPIDYYSCFISYASADQACAEALHVDLQSKGVRCWFAPHNLEIGEVITSGIDEAIRISDKLLIILSEASVKSRWVEFEVNQALHREVEQGRTMLFPIRLDNAVLHTSSGWAAQLRTRHIGDFRGWEDHDRYQAAFTRLLRDLKRS